MNSLKKMSTIAGIGYLIIFITGIFSNFLLPNYADYKNMFLLIVAVPGIVGELSLTFWLLFKGVTVQP